MSALHVLELESNVFHVFVHTTTPAGNNSVGVSWKNVILAAGLNKTTMVEGTLAGQITTAEKATVVSGDVIEAELFVPLLSGGTANARLTEVVTAAYNNWLAAMQVKYAYYGKVL